MEVKKGNLALKVLCVISYVVMIIVNVMAVVLPINGVTPGQVSDSYPNLFAPAGITFSIWSVIYILLLCFTIYQLGNFPGTNSQISINSANKIRLYFVISSIANAAWIFSWHYKLIPLSMLLMIIILISLIKITNELSGKQLSFKENLFVRLPFSIYFGWITVATIANVTTLLVSLGWDGFGIPQEIWAVIVMIIGAAIGLTAMLKNKDIAYGLVIIWAYIGIWLKHMSPAGFNGQYTKIITTVIICIIILLVGEIYLSVSKKNK